MQLFINNQRADLADDTPIALTFQINNLAEVKNQQGNTSNQFKLPLTLRNRAILGFPDDIAFCSNLPYTQYAARLVQDGMEVIPYGIAELNSIEQDMANITILSGNVDFFEAIDAGIYDMGDSTTVTGAQRPFAPYDHAWTLDNVINSQRKTEGWIWPVVDYGKIDNDTSRPIDVRYLRPGFFLKTAIEIIVANAGFKAKGSLLTDPLYNKLIVQFANDSFEHGSDIQNQPDRDSISVRSTAPQPCSYNTANAGHEGTIMFQQVDFDLSNAFYAPSSAFVAPEDMSATVNLTYSLQVRGTRKNHSADVRVFIQLYDPASNQLTTLVTATHNADHPVNEYAAYSDQKLSADVDLLRGQSIAAAYHFQFDGSEAIIAKGAVFAVANKQTEVLYKQQVQCERIFPDISQKDLLKDTLQRFGIICQTDNSAKTVTFASLRDIVNNIPRANDWTAKCIDQGKTISFQLGGYAQVNTMKYKSDDNVTPDGFADSQINVADATLPATTNLFESQFAPSLNRPWINGSIAAINKVDQTDSANTNFSISTQPRILINDAFNAASISFTDGTETRVLNNDLVSVPYFDKPGGAGTLKFDALRLKYYPELERVLKETKKIVRYFLLTPRDIAGLDLLIPVYLQQDGAYFYINKIDSWRKGQPTRAELVKLG